MGWKDWPYWLKGGIIAIGIYAILTLILLPFGETGGHPSVAAWQIPSFLPAFLFGALLFSFTKNTTILNFFIPIEIFIFYFGSGALIGWVAGKIKSKK